MTSPERLPPRRMPFAALRHRDFRLFWLGLTASAFGMQITTVTMAWQIYELTNSALQIGLLGLARGLPQMVLVLFGGLLADAVDRRRLLIATQALQLVASLILMGVTFSGAVTPVFLYAASVLLALATALENPARQSLVPNLVPRVDLTNALAIQNSQRQAAMIGGPALAGILLGAVGPGVCYAVNLACWIGMIGALLCIPSRPQEAGGRRGMSFAALGQGLNFVWTHPVILCLMLLDFGVNLFGTPRALFPVYARDILEVGAQGLGLLYAATSAGSLVAALVMSWIGEVRQAGRWILIGVAVFCLTTAFFGLSHIFWLSLLLLAFEGAGNTVGAVLRGTINQLATPDNLRGRVTSVNNMFTNGGPQLGQFRGGLTAELMGPEASVVAGAVVTLALVAGVAAVPAVRNYEIRTGHAADG